MKDDLKHSFKQFSNLISNRFRKSINRRDAIGLSIFLHILIVLFFTSIFSAGLEDIALTKAEEDSIELEFIEEEKIKYSNDLTGSHVTNNVDGVNQTISESNASASGNSETSSTKKVDVAMESFMMQSLASLSEMSATFKFVRQQVAADSLNAIALIQVTASDKKILSNGRIKVIGWEDGNCPGRNRRF